MKTRASRQLARVVGLCVLLAAVPARGQCVPFSTCDELWSFPRWVASAFELADFNGDGAMDVILCEGVSASQVVVRLGNGAGQFLVASTIQTTSPVVQLISHDVSGDGFLDLFLLTYDGVTQTRAEVRLGDGSGSFGSAVPVDVDPQTFAIEVADGNGDGAADLLSFEAGIFYAPTPLRVSLSPGTGNGGFGPRIVTEESSYPVANQVTVADYDEDGRADLVASSVGSAAVTIAFGQADGHFGPSNVIATGPANTAAGDLNRDGHQDLVLNRVGEVSVLYGDGGGGFSAPVVVGGSNSFPAGGPPRSVDLNHDDDLDIVAHYGSGFVEPWVSDGLGGFVSAGLFPTATGFFPLSAADVTGDGQVDLVVATGSFGLARLEGDGTGSFGEGRPFDGSVDADELIELDLNADGHLDLIEIDFMEVLVHRGDGMGGFALTTVLDAGVFLRDGAVGDFNEDGAPDLLLSSLTGDEVVLYGGDGAGGFARLTSVVVENPGFVTVADFDHDGHLDWVSIRTQTSQMYRARGDGLGGFAPVQIESLPGTSYDAQAADLDNDGDEDLLVWGEQVWSLLNDGSGAFQALPGVDTGAWLRYLTLGDFDGDGTLDAFAASNSVLSPVFGLAGSGQGSFLPVAAVSLPGGVNDLVSADFDADGRLDLAVARSGGIVSVLLGDGDFGFSEVGPLLGTRTAQIVAGSFDADDTIDLAGTGIFLPNRCEAARFLRGDANEDGVFDLADPVTVLEGLFGGAGLRIDCADAADANDDGAVDVADGVFALRALFAVGPTLPSPTGNCGLDPTDDTLLPCTSDGCP